MYKMVSRLKLFGDDLYCSTARGRYIQQRPTSLLCYFQDDMTDIFKSHWYFWTAERCLLNILVFAKFHLLTNNNCLKMHVEIKARNICSSSQDHFFYFFSFVQTSEWYFLLNIWVYLIRLFCQYHYFIVWHSKSFICSWKHIINRSSCLVSIYCLHLVDC